MNIEEKARAYDEALERCKEWASGTWGHSVDDSPKDIAEFIFPQLAESEDERTRKEILDFIKSFWADHKESIPQISSWIAWLEKQKELFESGRGFYYYDGEKTIYMGCPATEEKHYDFAMSQQEKQKEPHFTKRNALFDKCVENCDPEVMNKVSDEIDEMLQKEQKPIVMHTPRYAPPEQKPAEWSEEDEGELQNAIDALEFLGKKGVYKSESGYDAALQAASWLKDLPERFNLQPKQEWNEEDEIMIGSLINYFEGDALDCSTEDVVNRLKSLRPQYHGDVTMTEAYKMGFEAGKASSWKPSEHQMSILKAVKEYVGKGSGYWGEGLGSLIDDLEKLM